MGNVEIRNLSYEALPDVATTAVLLQAQTDRARDEAFDPDGWLPTPAGGEPL